MRNVLLGILLTVLVLFIFKYCSDKKKEQIVLKENTALIQEQIKNVGKLIVTEGHFSQIYNYKNSKPYFGDFLTAEKKALIVVNANVTVAYDLSKLEYRIDEANKILNITSIPEEIITINPDLEYYDIEADYFNPFNAEDYNRIKERVKASLEKKIKNSDLKNNAQNRLISELTKFYILTNSLGWTLQYNQTPITTPNKFSNLKL